MARFAGIDVGSHTTRLLIVSVEQDVIRPLHSRRIITGVAKGFGKALLLPEDGKRKTLEALKQYREIMDDYRVANCRCGATGIFRKARDSVSFLSEVKKHLELDCTILSEREEALTSFKGTASFLKNYMEGKKSIVFDLGGSTTEFIFSENGRPIKWKSVPIGAATITKHFLWKAPAEKKDTEEAASFVDKKLYEELMEFRYLTEKNLHILIGSAGTVSTLGAIKMKMTSYVPYKMCGLRLEAEWISRILKDILQKSLKERQNIPGMEKGREDVIAGGTLIVQRIMKFFDCNNLIVSDAGLLEGLTLSAILGISSSNLTWQV